MDAAGTRSPLSRSAIARACRRSRKAVISNTFARMRNHAVETYGDTGV